MIYVKRKFSQESIDSMLKRFSKKVKDSGLMEEIKEKQFYEKPSTVKRRKFLANQRRRSCG
jgi:ribosomal protein S21